VEHSAVLATCKYLEKEGVKVTYLAVDKYGMASPEDLKKAITDKTVLVTIMHANNEVGTVNPIKELAGVCKEKKVLFHTDAVQSFGKLDIDVEAMQIDLLSLSAHKIYGPKGVGALYIRKGVKIIPLSHGGHHERNLRAGTENVAGIVGLGKAVELAAIDRPAKNKRLAALRDRLYDGLKKSIDDIYLNGHPSQRLPGTVNISFRFIEGESIMLNLDLAGICVSTGSACTSGTLEPSHVLTAMGIVPELAQGSIRFSLGEGNTAEEVDRCVSVLPDIIKRLRAMSPLKK
jgi:cysteine desulfurase